MKKIGKYTPGEMKIVEPQLMLSERWAIKYNERAKTKTIYWYEIKPQLVRLFEPYVGWGCRLDCFNNMESFDTWLDYLKTLTPNTK
jgi:hypothetical protein